MDAPITEYGSIPFDLFALEHWDYSAEREDDDRQWVDVGRRYLALTPLERMHYHVASDTLSDPPPESTPPSFITAGNIDRVFRGGERQTPIERSLARPNLGGIADPIWLRTNYQSELRERYEGLVAAVDIDRDHILDDSALYDYGSSRDGIVSGILSRVPSICDIFTGSVPEDYVFMAIPKDGTQSALTKASNQACRALFVADEVAILKGHIWILWLDHKGVCVWDNKVEPGDFDGLMAAFVGGYSLEEAIDSHGLFDNHGED